MCYFPFSEDMCFSRQWCVSSVNAEIVVYIKESGGFVSVEYRKVGVCFQQTCQCKNMMYTHKSIYIESKGIFEANTDIFG